METLTEKKDLPDNRLFPNTLLYCEGRNRTHLRGWFHFFMCISFFPLLLINYLYIYYQSNKSEINFLSFFVCIFNLLVIYIAHCFSAYYHICELNTEDEIYAQKRDIVGANLYVATSYLPMALLLFPRNIGILLIIMATAIVGWNIYGIVNSRYSLHQPAYICLLQILFGYYVYNYLNKYEFTLNCSGLLFLCIGAIFLLYEICPLNVDAKYFDYFEMYHGISVICLTTICLMNYNIFKRTFITKPSNK